MIIERHKPRKQPAPHQTAPWYVVFNFYGAIAVWTFVKPQSVVQIAVLILQNAVKTTPQRI